MQSSKRTASLRQSKFANTGSRLYENKRSTTASTSKALGIH